MYMFHLNPICFTSTQNGSQVNPKSCGGTDDNCLVIYWTSPNGSNSIKSLKLWLLNFASVHTGSIQKIINRSLAARAAKLQILVCASNLYRYEVQIIENQSLIAAVATFGTFNFASSMIQCLNVKTKTNTFENKFPAWP